MQGTGKIVKGAAADLDHDALSTATTVPANESQARGVGVECSGRGEAGRDWRRGRAYHPKRGFLDHHSHHAVHRNTVATDRALILPVGRIPVQLPPICTNPEADSRSPRHRHTGANHTASSGG